MLAAAGLGKLGSCEWFDPRKRSKQGSRVLMLRSVSWIELPAKV